VEAYLGALGREQLADADRELGQHRLERQG
jgi:hypothetical protein